MVLALIAAAAAFHSVDINTTLSKEISKAGSKSGLAVVVPPSVPITFKNLHGDVTASKGSYLINLSPVKDCFGANACTIGYFIGDANSAPNGSKTVKLHQGLTGKFKPLSCGGSCSPASVSWNQNDVTYEVSLSDHPGKSDKKYMVKLANSAIDAGGYGR